MRRSDAVGCREVGAAAHDLLAADEAVVARIAQLESQLALERRDDDLVVLVQRQAAHQARRADSALPQLVGGVLVEAQRDGGVVQRQAPDGLEHHVGDGVGGVLARLRDDAADGGVLVGVVGTGDIGDHGRASVIEAGGLEEERVHQLLGLILGEAPGIQIGFEVGPGVLVEAAERQRRLLGLGVDEQMVQKRRLAGLPERGGGTLGDMVQAFRHAQQLGAARLVRDARGLVAARLRVAADHRDGRVADDDDRVVEQALVHILAHQVALMRVEPILRLLADGPVAGVDDLLGAGDQMACRQAGDVLERVVAASSGLGEHLISFGLPCLGHLAETMGLPERRHLAERLDGFRAHGQLDVLGLAMQQAVFAHRPQVGVVYLVQDPTRPVPFRPYVGCAKAVCLVADEDVVILHQHGLVGAHVIGGQRNAQHPRHVLASCIRLGDDAGALVVDDDDAIADAVVHRLYTVGHGPELVHASPSFPSRSFCSRDRCGSSDRRRSLTPGLHSGRLGARRLCPNCTALDDLVGKLPKEATAP